MESGGIYFTSKYFPRCESRYPQARLPLAIAVDPFDENLEVKEISLPRCKTCGAYPTEKDKESFAQTKWKCEYCQTKNETELPFEFSPTVDFEVQVDEIHAETLFMIDSSRHAHESGFFGKIAENIENLIPEEMVNYAVSCFSSSCTFLTQKKQIIEVPFTDEYELPASIWLKTRPESFSALKHEKPGQSCHILDALKMANDILKPNSRIIVFVGSQPHNFTENTNETFFRSSNITQEYQDIIEMLLRRHISVSFLCYRDQELDVNALSQISDILGGELILLEKNQINEVTRYAKEMCSAYSMRTQIRTINSIRLGSSFGFRPRNPNDFLMVSTESPIFPAELVSLGKKIHPVQLTATYFAHNGRKRVRVITRTVEMTDVLLKVFQGADDNIISKLFIAQLVEKILMGESVTDKFVRDAAWKMFYDYQKNGLFMDEVDKEDILAPDNLQEFVVKALDFLHSSAFSTSTERCARLYQLRRLTTCRMPLLNDVLCTKLCKIGTEKPLSLSYKVIEEGSGYYLFDGFTTYVFGADGLDSDCVKGVLKVIDMKDEKEVSYFKERLSFDQTPTLPSFEKFYKDLLEDIVTRGHMWVLRIDPKDIPDI